MLTSLTHKVRLPMRLVHVPLLIAVLTYCAILGLVVIMSPRFDHDEPQDPGKEDSQ